MTTSLWRHHAIAFITLMSIRMSLTPPDSPFTVLADSATATVTVSNVPGVPNGTSLSCKRYHLRGLAVFETNFIGVPTMWVRRANSKGMPNVTEWNDAERAPWGEVGTVQSNSAFIETYVYRLLQQSPIGAWFPCDPSQAKVAYTAVGPTVSLGVEDLSKSLELTIEGGTVVRQGSVRFRLSGLRMGPVKLEVFDIAGRRITQIVNRCMDQPALDVSWDGLDHNGRRVGRSLLLCRLQQGGNVRSLKLVRL